MFGLGPGLEGGLRVLCEKQHLHGFRGNHDEGVGELRVDYKACDKRGGVRRREEGNGLQVRKHNLETAL